MSNDARQQPLRIVTFNVLPFAYRVVSMWAQRHNHQLVSLITTPGPATRRNTSYRDIIAQLPPNQEVLITTRVKNLVPYLISFAPDFIISFTFPYLLPPEVLAVPRLGAVNLHPTKLPAYRGPNPLRPIYDGAPEFAATLHWTDGEFDTGAILSQLTRPIPAELTAERIGMGLFEVSAAALEAGMERAIAGD
jgi:methionyl-tRNA formyltransferase